jgi:hypothetical protein
MSCVGCRHADFEKIHSAFLAHYNKDPKLGEMQNATPFMATKFRDGSAETANTDSQIQMTLKEAGVTKKKQPEHS